MFTLQNHVVHLYCMMQLGTVMLQCVRLILKKKKVNTKTKQQKQSNKNKQQQT